MRKAGEKERKRKSARWHNAQREKKKAMVRRNDPLVRGKQQQGEGKQRALGKEKAAAIRLE
jgi:hypothetical protein